VLLPILLAVVLSLATIASLVLFAALTLDRRDRETARQTVRTSLAVEADRLAQLARDNSWWNEAYRHLIRELDPEWADENIGGYLHEAFELDLSLVLDRDDRVVIAYADGHRLPLPASSLWDGGARSLVAEARDAAAGRPAAATGYLRIGEVPYLVAASAFVDEDRRGEPPDGALLLLGRRLDQALAGKLGRLFGIPGLHLREAASGEAGDRMRLLDPRGTVVAALAWPEPTNARDLLLMLLPPLAAVVVAVVFLTWRFLATELAQRRRNQALLLQLATTDGLTGISNRRAFLERAQQEMLRSRRFGRPLALLMLDIDHFKRINDRHGHAVGDAALRSLAATVRGQLRQVDLFGRLGGEEFVVLLPETSAAAALEVAERIRAAVSRARVPTAAGDLQFTVSIGVVGLDAGDADFDALLSRSDQALYRAKERGRDRVEH
jgi:diguanylate cyclase (GGDEF)-like protein